MSTSTGQSLLHPLHERQRSRDSLTSSLFQPSRTVSPRIISKRRRARPRVECISSLVTMYEGHMVPPSVRRQSPTPTQRWVACTKEWSSSGYWKWVPSSGGL